jgi:hypothetical protein
MKNRVIPSEARNLALFLGPSEIPRFARNDRHFQSSRSCPSADGDPQTMKMREAPWSAAAKLPPWNPNQKAVAGATALQGAFIQPLRGWSTLCGDFFRRFHLRLMILVPVGTRQTSLIQRLWGRGVGDWTECAAVPSIAKQGGRS